MYGVNVFMELGWQQHLQELYIVHKKTLKLIYHLNLTSTFTDGVDTDKSETQMVFSGGIVGINEILKNISDSESKGKGVSLIQQKGKYIMMEHGQDVIVCFFTDKNMDSLRFYLRKIREAWETYYLYPDN